MTSEQNKEKLAGKIAAGILSLQSRFSGRMNRLKNLKGILIAFCILGGSLSIYFFVSALTTKPKSKIRIDHISSPRSIDEPSDEMYDNRIPGEIYQQIQDYKKYADSAGVPIRPGLADSMRILEEMYLQQQK